VGSAKKKTQEWCQQCSYLGGKAKRVESFLEAFFARRHINKHEHFTTATKAVLQQVSQLAVAIWHMAILQYTNDQAIMVQTD